MRQRLYILLVLAASTAVTGLAARARAETPSGREYQLKAAFLFNFLKFVEGERFQRPPEAGRDAAPQPFRIGVLGEASFGNAFEPLKSKTVKNRPVVVQRFKGFDQLAEPDGRRPRQHPDLDAIRQCHVLFVCASEENHLETILAGLRRHDILTVADVPGFLEAGGIVNFVLEDKKVRFEVNTAATIRARLHIRSTLLGLAKRIVKHDAFEEQDKDESPTENPNQ